MRMFVFILLCLIPLCFQAVHAAERRPEPPKPPTKPSDTKPVQPPKGAKSDAGVLIEGILFKEDVVYGKAGKVDLKLDLFIPPGEGPFPAVISLHGGSWAGGTKSDNRELFVDLAKRGIIAVSVDYRLAPEYKFPAQLEDCKCAVRFLRDEAKKLKLDPERIGALGESSGAQLALLLAFMGPEDGLEGTSGHAGFSSKVRAVVNLYGRSDFTVPGSIPKDSEVYLKNYVGTLDQASPIMKRASPITYLTKDDGPVLTIHGAKDNLVPPMLSKRLHEKLKGLGIEERLEFFEKAEHNEWSDEDWKRAMAMAVEFLDKHLKVAKKP